MCHFPNCRGASHLCVCSLAQRKEMERLDHIEFGRCWEVIMKRRNDHEALSLHGTSPGHGQDAAG